MSRIVSFCFDDGFRGSAQTICKIFERRGHRACFAVLARPEAALDPYLHGADLGDWAFWREVSAAGHEVALHGLVHERYDKLSLREAQAHVRAALAIMEAQMPGFHGSRSVFHVPYLSAKDETVEWLRSQFLSVRLAGAVRGLNRLEDWNPGSRVDCICCGPDDVCSRTLARLREFATQTGWLVIVMHGVDGEGWGSVKSEELEQLVEEAAAIAEIETPDRLLAKILRRATA